MELEIARELIQFINASPSCYHAADTAARMLSERGYARLWESQPWRLAPGCGYYVLRGDASLIAFRIPRSETAGFLLAAAHSDSPTFKIRETAEVPSAGNCLRPRQTPRPTL